MLAGCNARPDVKYRGGELFLLDGFFAVDYKLGDLVAFRGHDVYHSVLAVLPEEEGKAAKRFTVNFFSTDGTYKKEREAADRPKKKPRLSWRDRVAPRRCP